MKRFLVLLLLFFIQVNGFASRVKIGLYTNLKTKEIVVIPASGSYSVWAGGKNVLKIGPEHSARLTVEKNNVKITHGGRVVGSYSRIKFIGNGLKNSFRIKSINPDTEAWPFDDDLEISVSKDHLRSVNFVELHNYVAGVLESEIGSASNLEFLKAKSIICRTYAMGHLKRHQNDGFELCDQVHCQAYKSRSRFNPTIRQAVDETLGMVIVDQDLKLITASFHSNCGGMTANSEDVWSQSLPYLRSVVDTFCLDQSKAVWEKKINADAWETYLNKSNKKDVESIPCELFDSFQSAGRHTLLAVNGLLIPLIKVRTDFNLKSSWFNLTVACDSVLFSGRGFGHGVGLCQEGALKMAELGHDANAIIRFYYQNVTILNHKQLKFIQE